MKNYDICKNVNDFYFNNYASIALAAPNFFSDFSQEGEAVDTLKKMIDRGQLDQAIAQAEIYLQQFPPETQHAFLAMQIFALWQQGKVPNADLIDYFTTLEEILPQDSVVNFNKAAIYVRDKNFNKAVEELCKARRKNPDHVLSIALLFVIYYFSGDEQWRGLFKIITDNKLFVETIINLVTVIESIKDKKSTPLYLNADKENIEQANNALLNKFPTLTIEKQPSNDNILFIAAESNYLREFGITFLLSELELPDKNFSSHIHLYNPTAFDLELLQAYDKKFPQLNLSYSFERGSTSINTEKLDYYASMRFARAYEILNKAPAVKKIAVIDADVLIRKNPFARAEVLNNDVVLTSTYEAAPCWEKFAGGFSCFPATGAGFKAFAHVANIILKNFEQKKEFWFIDQVALFDMYQSFTDKAKIQSVSLDEFFGVGMRHTEEAIAWTYTHEDKNRDNPMNRERKRLFDQYGITRLENSSKG